MKREISTVFLKFIFTSASLLHFHPGSVQGANLAQFGLPPCCYAGIPPPLEFPWEGQEAAGNVPEVRTTLLDESNDTDDKVYDETFNSTGSSHTIRTFIFPMASNSRSVKAKRTANNTGITDKSAPLESSDEEEQIEQVNKTTSRLLPPDWKSKLRRVLFRSFKDTVGSSTNRSDALWEVLYVAPLQVVAAATRREIPGEEALASLETMTENDRIAGVMVNTEDGIELRTSETLDTAMADSNPVPDCACHLIHHGDSVLAYFSIGFSGPNLEYLIYPLPHNVPTPPIFEPFNADPIIRPSPVDLNPIIASRSINEVPFHPSLEFGVAAASQYAGYQQNGAGIDGRLGNGMTNFGEPFPDRDNAHGNGIGYPYGNDGAVATAGSGIWNGLGRGLPYWPLQGLRPNLGFGGLLPPYPPIVYFPPPPLLRPGPTQKGDEQMFQNPPVPNTGLTIGPLDPFNPNHPKSIQEILYGPGANVGYVPIPPLPAPPGVSYGELPPGPNPGLYAPDYESYPRNPPLGKTIPPLDQVHRTRPPGIYVNEVNGNRQPDYNYNDRGLTDKPVNYDHREREDCYKNDCNRRYGRDRYGGNPRNLRESTNSKGKVRDRRGRHLNNIKHTEVSYLLDF